MNRRHLKWTIPGGYLLLLLIITIASHASRSDTPGLPVAAPVGPTTAASTTPSSTAPITAPHASSPERPANHYAGRLVVTPAGILPDPTLTPGAVNTAVTQANLNATICRSGFATNERPATAYTEAIETKQLHAGYSYHGDTTTSDYEEDHLISLELGGSPTALTNLWPEPLTVVGALAKDSLEDTLHTLVCHNHITLAAAQHAIATNWTSAYNTYVTAPARAQAQAAAARAAAAKARRAAQQRAAQQRAATSRAASSAAAPPPTSCTQTASGTCIRGGEFCRQDEYGTQGTDAEGDVYTCKGDPTHPHWEN